MKILSFLCALLLVVLHGAAGFALPPSPFVRCGYRGTFCTPGRCPLGNAYLGVCGLRHSCCKW
ncbi:gallinacin-4-like [Phaenicophaeus curvirostris]|uniref:gallinacin-4-like n=1 Tax=Phaenicophaeus curvirostris TaxID=33595 RepID=UPI0037F0DCB7